jgi:group I intron endonuclease
MKTQAITYQELNLTSLGKQAFSIGNFLPPEGVLTRINRGSFMFLEKPRISGIYRITNLKTGKVYVGSSVHVYQRMNYHIYVLRGQYHKSVHLQNAWNKYGECSFKFELLEETRPEELASREQYWLDKTKAYDRKYGYNTAQCAESPNRNRHISESAKQKQRDTWSKKYAAGYVNPFSGKKHTKKTRKHWSIIRSGIKTKPCSWKGTHLPKEWRDNIGKGLRKHYSTFKELA